MPVLSAARDKLVKWAGHYLPVALPVILVILPWLLLRIVGGSNPPNHAADIVFATASFWIWALTTNAHSGHLVKGSGHRAGTKEQLREEFPVLILSFLVTIGLYLVCHVAAADVGLGLALFSVGIPVVSLGSP